jgi:hypothetical protein
LVKTIQQAQKAPNKIVTIFNTAKWGAYDEKD